MALERPMPDWLLGVLDRRGISPAGMQGYLEPSLTSLHDPDLIADMELATARLEAAVRQCQRITVFGDYDVDGVCSTSILVEFLRHLDAQVGYYIPDRRTEGYGLNEAAVREIAPKTDVLITTDCGITAHQEIALAVELGIDVIVVDHHRVAETLPAAVACLDPHRPDCKFPFDHLCAAGVAFFLVAALRRRLRTTGFFADRREPDVRDLLELAAMATVADMVPLRETNRVLVAAGLRRMAVTKRQGLLALFAVSQVNPARVTSTDLGFRIGPRINARGRVHHAAEAVELLLTSNPTEARSLARALDEANHERRALEKRTVSAAQAQLDEQDLAQTPAIVLSDPGWHPGVLGLVASRLANRHHRPTIIIGEGGKGSGRTAAKLDLHAALSDCSEHLLRFGGHPAAAGLTITAEAVPSFREAFDRVVRGHLGDPPFVAELQLDLEVRTDELSFEMLAELERLAPFGQANPEPLFAARQVPVQSKRVVGDNHLKLQLGEHGHDAIAFGLGNLADALPNEVDVAFYLERNLYQGRQSLQLRVQDLRAPAEC